jgi:hypothetical protein
LILIIRWSSKISIRFRLAIKFFFKWLPLVYHKKQLPTHISLFKMSTRFWAFVRQHYVILMVDSFVIIEVMLYFLFIYTMICTWLFSRILYFILIIFLTLLVIENVLKSRITLFVWSLMNASFEQVLHTAIFNSDFFKMLSIKLNLLTTF